MNNVPGIPNMNPMAGPVGPVGPPMNVMNNGAMGGPQPSAPGQIQMNDSSRTLLNTYIYEYFIRYNMFAAARGVLEADPQIRVMKESPGKMRDENGNLLGNGLGDSMDTDSKDGLDHKRPDDLPAPNVPTPLPDSCFLYEWFCLFWDMFNSQKGKGSSGQVNQYVHHTQIRQQQQRDLLRQMRPDHLAQQQYHQQLIARGMPNGGMHMGMKPGNHLPRAAIANSQNPQAMQMLQNKAAGQMQRDPADMDGNRVRPADGEADNAPSPKRPRLEGGAPFNPNQPVMINGRPGQGMPGQPQHHGNQMPNKPLPNAGGPQNQGSPMVPQGPDGNSLTQYYNPGDLGPANMRPGGPNGQGAAGSNHALQDYQMQLMLLEQQNKKRLMMARQEQDLTTTGNTPRMDGPGGPGAPPGPNAQGIQGTSPPGGRSGASPNPSEQMRRTNQQQMANAANMGSPLPDGAQSRGSPGAMNFMGGNMDPNAGPHFMNMNMASQMNGGMRPPSSHPPFNGHMSQQQLMARQQAAAAAQGAPMQWQGGPNGQMPGQPPQPQVPGGPAPNQRSMPPPPSAPATAVAAANARNATASPQVSNAAPPTPQQATKAAPKKKETKSAKAKAAAQKKNNANLNNAAATPAPEPTEAPQEGPTPATPMTPVNAANFAKNQGVNAGQVVPNGQPPAPAPQQQAPPVPPPTHTDPNQNTSFLDPGAMDFQDFNFSTNPLQTDNVLDGFDFDSFLQDGTNGEEGPFDFNTGFSMEPDTTIGATE